MTEPITETIRELRELLKKATPGDWSASQSGTTGGHNPSWWSQANVESDWGETLSVVSGFCPKQSGRRGLSGLANAQLIAAMKNALPALLDAAEKAKRYEMALENIRGLEYLGVDDDLEGVNKVLMDIGKIAYEALSSQPREPK